VRNEVLHRVEEDRHILHTINRRKVNFTGLILRGNCIIKHLIEGKIKG
jgi:hypothetical protein